MPKFVKLVELLNISVIWYATIISEKLKYRILDSVIGIASEWNCYCISCTRFHFFYHMDIFLSRCEKTHPTYVIVIIELMK